MWRCAAPHAQFSSPRPLPPRWPLTAPRAFSARAPLRPLTRLLRAQLDEVRKLAAEAAGKAVATVRARLGGGITGAPTDAAAPPASLAPPLKASTAQRIGFVAKKG